MCVLILCFKKVTFRILTFFGASRGTSGFKEKKTTDNQYDSILPQVKEDDEAKQSKTARLLQSGTTGDKNSSAGKSESGTAKGR